MELYFCNQCEKRIPSEEVEDAKAQAAAFGDQLLCGQCRPKAAPVEAKAPRSTARLSRNTTTVESSKRGAQQSGIIRMTAPSGRKSPLRGSNSATVARGYGNHDVSTDAAFSSPARRANTQLILGGSIAAISLIGIIAFIFWPAARPANPPPPENAVNAPPSSEHSGAATALIASTVTTPNYTLATPPPKKTATEPESQPAPRKVVTTPTVAAVPKPSTFTEKPPVVIATDLPELRAVALQGDAPKIDGLLDDLAWRSAATADLVSKTAGGAARGKARASITFDDKNLYIAVQCFETEQALQSLKADATQSHPDNAWMDDSVEFFIDPANTRGSYYQIIVNSKGVHWTGYLPKPKKIESWNPGLEVAANVGTLSWTVELAIPFSALDRTGKMGSEWAFNIVHTRTAENELICWSPLYNESNHTPARFGRLLGIPAR